MNVYSCTRVNSRQHWNNELKVDAQSCISDSYDYVAIYTY